jgi:hypothetical protein
LFTPEELAEMAAADAEIEENFSLTNEDLKRSRDLDKEAVLGRKDNREKKITENQRAYREANREKIAENQRAYREANREKINAYMREYMKKRRAAAV